LFFIGALKDAGAARVTAIMPYFAYSRKDRRTKSNDPVTTRYVAAILQSVGVDSVVTMDIHNPAAFENSFTCPSINITTFDLFADHFARTARNNVDTIVSPDLGGIKATRLFLEAYAEQCRGVENFAVMDKKRSEGVVSGTGLIGNVGKQVLIMDDMIGSGSTMCRAANDCKKAGAESVVVGATHGLFENGAPALFDHPGIDEIIVSDSVAIDRIGLSDECLDRITILGSAGLLAQCVREMQG
jgi:ribose-phosphate pyrophosphokinase